MGVHWGTFALSDEALDQPPKDLLTARKAKGLTDAEFTVLKIGETRSVPARTVTGGLGF
jgi:N-acyl-phosphatidylethanolamine-hydrolysing phospholipase D